MVNISFSAPSLSFCKSLFVSGLLVSCIKVYAWVHAYLHRVEGDEGNAEYWYNRAVQPVCTTSLDAEWKALYAEFEGLDRC